ncbi:MAG: glycosyltransferase [Candidatus Lokiarchaeota archaeon]|nr:glycosyltransferase [Candidatus Lokiarchaeota archaeon]
MANNLFYKMDSPRWKRYVYSIIGAEITTTTRFYDSCIQVSPLQHDPGLLYKSIECKKKAVKKNVNELKDLKNDTSKRTALLYNGNFCYSSDIEKELKELNKCISSTDRIILVLYNPFIKFIYKIADHLGLRSGPLPPTFLTHHDLSNITSLAGYEIVRIRPSVYLPFPIPLFSKMINKIFPVIPLIKHISLVWVVFLRPIINLSDNPSLSIIIPARNEAGNIKNAIERLPDFNNTKVEVIFVEGNSQDDTWVRIQEIIIKGYSPLSLKAFKQNGKGKYDAVRMGFEKAENEIITILDADLTMPPEYLNRYYDAFCNGFGDFINGNRLVYQMDKEAMRPLNRIGNIFFAKILSVILGLKIGDSLCGTKMFSRNDYERIVEWRKYFGDFDPFGDFEMLFAASELALGVQDIPIQYKARTYGSTQISRFRDGLQLFRMTWIGFFRLYLGKV